ncbi:MAG: flagellin, partial [Planctomycetota bacterium]|nr:flagellin [Planctomycetota bacterium]
NGISLFGVRGDPQIVTVTLQIGREEGDTLEVEMPEAMRIAVGLKDLSARTPQAARGGLAQLDASIDLISRGRGSLGATRNRLEIAARSLATERENTSASRSRILDVDYAVATAELTRVQILQNASATVLSQANVLPSLALTLLDGSVS